MSKRILSLVLAMVMVLGSFSFTFAAEDTTTVEVAETVDEKVQWLVDHEYVVGDSGGLRLEDNIRRAEVAVIVAKALGLEDVADAAKLVQGQFTDVTPYGDFNWANGYINALSGKGVLNGYTDGTIRPANNISLQEVATMMVMAYDEEAPTGTWPMNMIVRASELGLFDDIDTTAYAANATRQDTFVLIYNAINNLQLGDHDVVKAIVLENYRVESIDKDEIVIEVIKEVQRSQYADESRDIEGDQYKVVVPEDFDVEYLLGKVANFTFSGVIKDGKEVLEVVVDDTYEYLQGPVEEIEDDEIVIDGEDYTVLKDERYGDDDNRGEDERIFQTYFNNEDYKYRDFYRELDEEEVDFARVTVKNGKVLFIDAYNFDDIAPVAEDINDDDEVAYFDDDEDGDVNELTVDEDVYVLNYAEETITSGDYKDIAKNDVIHWYEDDNDNLTVVVRPYDDNKVEGEYEEAIAARAKDAADIEIVVDDEEYSALIDTRYRIPVYSTTMDIEEFYTLTDDYDEELEPYEDEEVVLLMDMLGNVQLIGAEMPDKTFYAVISDLMNYDFELVKDDEDGRKGEGAEYKVSLRGTDFFEDGDELDGTKERQLAHFNVEDLVLVTADEDMIEELDLQTADERGVITEIDDDVITIDGEDYDVSNRVVVFDVVDDPKATTIDDVDDDYFWDEAPEVTGYVVLNDNDYVVAIVIEEGETENDLSDPYLVRVRDVRPRGNDYRLYVETADGDRTTHLVAGRDAKDLVSARNSEVETGALIEICFDDGEEIEDEPDIQTIDVVHPGLDTYEVVRPERGDDRREDEIRLEDIDGVARTMRISNSADIFGDPEVGDVVAININNRGVLDIVYVVDEDVTGNWDTSDDEEETEGTVTYISATRIFVDDARYTLDDGSVLVDEEGTILAVGGTAIDGLVDQDDLVEVTEVEDGVVLTMVFVQDTSEVEAEEAHATAVAALEDAIADAQALVDAEYEVDVDSEITTLESAITVAQGVFDDEDATTEELNNAVTALETAIGAFEDAVVAAEEAVTEEAILETINDATNEIQLYNALVNAEIDNVLSNLKAEYFAEISDEADLDAVQGAVDRVNAEYAMPTATFNGNVLRVSVNSDLAPYELEVDHDAALPEFSVYASTTNPYGDSEADFEELEVTVDYADGTWIIDFGTLDLSGIEFYLKVIDTDGNEFGSMYNGGYLTVN